MDDNQVFRQAPECLAEEMGEDILLYNPESATTLHLNHSSALVWRVCDGERSVGEIIAALSEAYPESANEIAADVEAAISEFSEQGVLVAIN